MLTDFYGKVVIEPTIVEHTVGAFKTMIAQIKEVLEEFASCIRLRSGRRHEQWENLLETISELTVGDRPGRHEPRELKRRAKNYKLMQTPRDSSRNSYASAA